MNLHAGPCMSMRLFHLLLPQDQLVLVQLKPILSLDMDSARILSQSSSVGFTGILDRDPTVFSMATGSRRSVSVVPVKMTLRFNARGSLLIILAKITGLAMTC